MKRLSLLMLSLVLAGHGAVAQTSFSCNYREYCEYDGTDEAYTGCEGYAEHSLFELNQEKTMFIHTIESMQSAYYIKEKEYDARKNTWNFAVVSDVGNKYIYVFDEDNMEIRCLFMDEGYEGRMIRFKVKSIFE